MIRILLSSLKRYVSCFFLLSLTTPAWGFDLTRHSAPVPALSIQVVPKDAIPAIDNPEVVPASAVDDLVPEEQVIGVVIGEEARAYPIRILHGHEIVNDDIGGRPIAVTW
jgi:hypothetical protein